MITSNFNKEFKEEIFKIATGTIDLDSFDKTIAGLKKVYDNLDAERVKDFSTIESFYSPSLSKGEILQVNRIVIIGAGGTGGWFIPRLIKILNDAKSKNMIGNMEVIIVDGDSIEEKNLLRQNFIINDIGKNKAEVMATRYGAHASKGISVGYIPKYVFSKNFGRINKEHESKFTALEELLGHRSIVFNFIDNGITRKSVHLVGSILDSRVIDVGNHESNGQLTYSDYHDRRSDNQLGYHYLQLPEQLLDHENVSVFNCANMDVESVNQMFIANDVAAMIAANHFNSMILGRAKFDCVEFITGGKMGVTCKSPRLYSSLVRVLMSDDINGDSDDHELIAVKNSVRKWQDENNGELLSSYMPVSRIRHYYELILRASLNYSYGVQDEADKQKEAT